MAGWFGTLIALPMSWQRLATTTSSSAPARSARVAVWRQWVSWSVAKPSTIESRLRSMARMPSATRPWFFAVSAPMTAHCSAVDSSMRVKVSAMTPVCRAVAGTRPSAVEDVVRVLAGGRGDLRRAVEDGETGGAGGHAIERRRRLGGDRLAVREEDGTGREGGGGEARDPGVGVQ